MQGHNPVKIQLGILLGLIPRIHRKVMSGLGKAIHNDPNRVISLYCAGQTHNKVHGNILPFPNRDR